MLTIYHGSDQVVERPRFGFGKPYNDYGLGFYCTEHADMAREWAVGYDHDGFVNAYVLDDNGLAVVDLDAPGYTVLNWLAVLLQNRWFDVRAPLANEARAYLVSNFAVDLSSADLVKGYRADDSYFAFAQDFISGSISYQQLARAMKLGELGRQVMVKRELAFSRLSFEGAEPVPREVWLPRRMQRDRNARSRYFDHERNARQKGDLFVSQIIDERMVLGDARLQ